MYIRCAPVHLEFRSLGGFAPVAVDSGLRPETHVASIWLAYWSHWWTRL